MVVNFASSRSAFSSTIEMLGFEQIKNIAIIAEGVPERETRMLIRQSRAQGVNIIGPATVGYLYNCFPFFVLSIIHMHFSYSLDLCSHQKFQQKKFIIRLYFFIFFLFGDPSNISNSLYLYFREFFVSPRKKLKNTLIDTKKIPFFFIQNTEEQWAKILLFL